MDLFSNAALGCNTEIAAIFPREADSVIVLNSFNTDSSLQALDGKDLYSHHL